MTEGGEQSYFLYSLSETKEQSSHSNQCRCVELFRFVNILVTEDKYLISENFVMYCMKSFSED